MSTRRKPQAEISEIDVEPVADRLAALIRMVAFAREDALTLGAEFPAHCLDVAAAALVAELRDRGLPVPFEHPGAGQAQGIN